MQPLPLRLLSKPQSSGCADGTALLDYGQAWGDPEEQQLLVELEDEGFATAGEMGKLSEQGRVPTSTPLRR